MKKGLKVFIGLVLVVGVIALAGFMLMRRQADAALASLPFAAVDMQSAADGVYEGEADAGLVKVRVRVTVAGGRIEAIDLLEHQNGLGTKAEAILGDMVADNTWDVDGVTGATLSSQTIKSAVSDALQKGSAI